MFSFQFLILLIADFQICKMDIFIFYFYHAIGRQIIIYIPYVKSDEHNNGVLHEFSFINIKIWENIIWYNVEAFKRGSLNFWRLKKKTN